jgi:hypothetical protein
MQRSRVLVVWHDAHAVSDGWWGVDESDDEPCRIETIGWLIPDAKADHVVVAQSLAADGDLYHVFAVPVGMVVSVQIL